MDVRSLLGLSRQSLPTVINANAITSSERQRAADLSPLPASLLAPSRPLACPAGHARGRQDSDVAGRRAVRTGRRLGASTRPASVPCHASPRRHAYVRGNWCLLSSTWRVGEPEGGVRGSDDAVLRNCDEWNYATQCKHGQPRQISFMLSTWWSLIELLYVRSIYAAGDSPGTHRT